MNYTRSIERLVYKCKTHVNCYFILVEISILSLMISVKYKLTKTING